jgi:hypothetical protein
MTFVPKLQDVTASPIGRDVLAARGDQSVEMAVVLAEDQLVRRGRGGYLGDGGD